MRPRDVLLILAGVAVIVLLVKLLLRPAVAAPKAVQTNPIIAAIDALPGIIGAFTTDSDRVPSVADINAMGLPGT